jgi:hypothetical protein
MGRTSGRGSPLSSFASPLSSARLAGTSGSTPPLKRYLLFSFFLLFGCSENSGKRFEKIQIPHMFVFWVTLIYVHGDVIVESQSQFG